MHPYNRHMASYGSELSRQVLLYYHGKLYFVTITTMPVGAKCQIANIGYNAKLISRVICHAITTVTPVTVEI